MNRRNNKIPWKLKMFCLFLDTFEYGKCLETGKKDQIPCIWNVSLNRRKDQILWIRKVSINMRNNDNYFQGLSSFSLSTEIVQKHGNENAYFLYRDFVVSMLKQENWPNSLNTSRSFVVLLFPDTYGKGVNSRNRKTTKSFYEAKPSLTRGPDRPWIR